MKNRFTKCFGFTLIETLIALSVFAIGIVGVSQVFPEGLKMARESKKTSVASYLAQSKIEEIVGQNFNDIKDTIEARHHVTSEPGSVYYQYERETIWHYVNSDLDETDNITDLKKITTTVYWQEDGIEESFQIATLITIK